MISKVSARNSNKNKHFQLIHWISRYEYENKKEEVLCSFCRLGGSICFNYANAFAYTVCIYLIISLVLGCHDRRQAMKT